MVHAFDDPQADVKTRIASVNSSVLLLAATFEEFIREMAREYARLVVNASGDVEDLPSTLTEAVWKKTLEGLSQARLKVNGKSIIGKVAKDSRVVFDSLCNFISGDFSQEIFVDLIHNNNSMRVSELNSMFRVAGLKNICARICEQNDVQNYYNENDSRVVHGLFMKENDEFIDKRNSIAHYLNARESVAASQVYQYINFYEVTSISLCACLEKYTT